jgi:hypothetical protein
VRFAEYLKKLFLLRHVVVSLRRRDQNLGIESDGADGLFFQVLDAQLKEEARNSGILENFGTLYPEIQVRHRVLL